MELQRPSWLDESFLVNILQREDGNKGEVAIIDSTVESAVAAGNNFTSQLLRVQVKYDVKDSNQVKTISFIVKAPIENGFYEDLTEKDLFRRELQVYYVLLPKMNHKLNYEFGPKAFYRPIERVLILKDLKEDGFVMCDKFKQLDFAHCKAVFSEIAKFHATSVACYRDDPSSFEIARDEYVYATGAPVEKDGKAWIEVALKSVIEVVKLTEEQKFIVDLLSNKRDGIWDSLLRIFKPRQTHLNVLNHGDFWINNILFKYEESKEISDVRFIDYQITRYANPALDLVHFMWTSANEEVREHRQEELYSIYIQDLNATMEQLGCEERLTALELRQDLKSASDWALITICQMLPIIMAEQTFIADAFGTDDFKNGIPDDSFRSLYNGKRFKSLLPIVFRQFQAWYSSL